MMEIFKQLAAPFPPEKVSWRLGSTSKEKMKGMALAYIDARDVMVRLDEAVGPENWQCRYPHTAGKTVCEIDIWVEGRGWVTKANGAGDTDIEAEKGALSDAFKRAAVNWGVGRYLYELPAPWVKIEASGRSFKISESEEPRLEALLRKDASRAPPRSDDEDKRTAFYLISDLRSCSTLEEYDILKSSPAFKASYNSLPNAFKDQVANVAKEVKPLLGSSEDFAA
jgi:hypothetical protein